jgi:hypothetical protein
LRLYLWHKTSPRASDIPFKNLLGLKPSPDSWADLEKLFPDRRAGKLATARLLALLREHHSERDPRRHAEPVAITTEPVGGDL